MKKLGSIVNKISDIVAIISYVVVAILVLMNVADIFMTKIFHNSISGAYEISECVLMCGVFAAFAYGQTKKTHVHMTLFIAKMPGRTKFIPYFLGNVLSTVMSLLLTYAMATQTMREYTGNTVTGILKMPYWPFYLISVIAMAVFTFTLLYEVLISFMAIFKDEYGEEIASHW